MRGVRMMVDMPELQAQLQRSLVGCQQPAHEVLLCVCLDDRLR